MRRDALTLGLALSVLLSSAWLVVDRERVEARLGWDEPEPVLVFVIPDPASARTVARAIAPDRILWRGAAGLALHGGRVVAQDLDGAAEVIEQAGWIDEPIRIVRLEPSLEAGGSSSSAPPSERAERAARLRELMEQPTLSRAEQLLVLDAMNEGVEF